MALGHISQCTCVDCTGERMRGGTQPNAQAAEVETIVEAAEKAADPGKQPEDDQLAGKADASWATIAAADEIEQHSAALRVRADELDKLVSFLRGLKK